MIAVTGITGLLGKHLEEDFNVHNVAFKTIERSKWDLSDWKTDSELDELFSECETMIHMGAITHNSLSEETTYDMVNANIRSCINLCNWAIKRNIHIIYISGATVYEDIYSRSILEDDAKTVNNFGGFYGFTKKIAEDIILHFKFKGLRATILRPSSIYGIGLTKDKMIMNFIHSAILDGNINISNPNSRVNLVNAFDVARGIRLAYLKKAEGIFNITGFVHSIEEIAKTISSSVDKKDILINVLNDSNDVRTRFDLNGNLAKSSFNYEPAITLKKGIRIILDKLNVEDMETEK